MNYTNINKINKEETTWNIKYIKISKSYLNKKNQKTLQPNLKRFYHKFNQMEIS